MRPSVREKVWRYTREGTERPIEQTDEELSRIFASWNQLDRWLWQVEGLRRVA
jgi:hypothetical protein